MLQEEGGGNPLKEIIVRLSLCVWQYYVVLK